MGTIQERHPKIKPRALHQRCPFMQEGLHRCSSVMWPHFGPRWPSCEQGFGRVLQQGVEPLACGIRRGEVKCLIPFLCSLLCQGRNILEKFGVQLITGLGSRQRSVVPSSGKRGSSVSELIPKSDLQWPMVFSARLGNELQSIPGDVQNPAASDSLEQASWHEHVINSGRI